MLKSTIAITGATGYIGSQILYALLSKLSGQQAIRVIARNSSDCAFLDALPVELVRADLLDPLSVMEALKGIDTVFHCAGLIAYTSSYREQLYNTNVIGTRNVVNACVLNKVRRIVLTSSIAAVGAAGDGSISTETTSFQDWQRRNGYMEAKYLAELEGLRGVAEGVEVVMVNPGVVIGIDRANPASVSSSNEVLRLIYNGRIPVSPSGSTGFVDVRDVADAHVAAWERGRSGERYLVVGQNMPFRDLFAAVAKMEGSRTGTVFMLPDLLGVMAGVGGELFSILSGRPSFISLESIRISSRSLVYSNQKSLDELGVRYRPLAETLKTIVI